MFSQDRGGRLDLGATEDLILRKQGFYGRLRIPCRLDQAFQVSRFLFYWRLVGVALFELTQMRALLIIFPNTFEYFFIFYEVFRLRWDPERMTKKVAIGAAVGGRHEDVPGSVDVAWDKIAGCAGKGDGAAIGTHAPKRARPMLR